MTGVDRVLKWIEPEDNPRNTIYGTIAAGLVIAAEDPRSETYPRVIAATLIAVAAYWLAHSYAHWVAERFGRNTSSSAREFVGALSHEWPLAEGAAVPVAALAVAWALGVPLTTGDTAALTAALGALLMFEVAGGLRRQLRPPQLLANAAVALVLGGSLFAVKNVLH
ncbi:MAG TPA: hypothetical protein VFN80_05470 [Acidothermaceae bacterium]|nr:hypothetical protein [Acidothermaceae bacterium]